ncbi:MAG TPA: glycoside hydrolase family 15 protein [Solirubrobacterales bacterium]|nr:glycoside hydrolase family 15 protein [Solirubrobacterales bacterium]
MRRTAPGVVLTVTALAGAIALSGATSADRRVPSGMPGPVPSFLGGDARAVRVERRWLARARPLGREAPPWARRMYRRSLLVLRAATEPRSGAVVAGARPGWAYVWPRDAGAVALAFATAGYRLEARRIARFLLRLDLEAAARFYADGEPVPGREAQGDAAGWVAVAARAAGVPARIDTALSWRDRADYQEKEPGEYLANAIASGTPPSRLRALFATGANPSPTAGAYLVRRAGDPASGLDTAAAWAVEPFPRTRLYPMLRGTLLQLAAASGRFGLPPSQDWDGGEDPWTAPTAWTAYGLAALGERRAALHLMAALRRAATPAGLLPERVDARTGAPRSTTPLAWSHAFAVLALRELWPERRRT